MSFCSGREYNCTVHEYFCERAAYTDTVSCRVEHNYNDKAESCTCYFSLVLVCILIIMAGKSEYIMIVYEFMLVLYVRKAV